MCNTHYLFWVYAFFRHLMLVTFQVSGGGTSIGGRACSEMVTCALRSTPKIPQLDGPIPDPYDDALSTPNVSTFNVILHLAGDFIFIVYGPFIIDMHINSLTHRLGWYNRHFCFLIFPALY